MGAWMKAVIVVACVSVTAASGVYLYSANAERVAVIDVQRQREAARAELMQFAGAKADEEGKVVEWCGAMERLARPGGSQEHSPAAANFLRNCRILGHL